MITVVANKSIIGVGSTAEITGGGLQLGSTTRPGNNVIIRNIKFTQRLRRLDQRHQLRAPRLDRPQRVPARLRRLAGRQAAVDLRHRVVEPLPRHGQDACCSATPTASPPTSATCRSPTTTTSSTARNQRHPRARFGEPVHVYNNYYRNNGLYGVASTENAGVLVEGNYFENVAFPCYSTSGYADCGPGPAGRSATTSSSTPASARPTGPSPSPAATTRTPWTPGDRARARPAGAGVGRI